MITTDGLAGLLKIRFLRTRKGISDWTYNYKITYYLQSEYLQQLSTYLFFRYCHIDDVCILEETDAEDIYEGLVSNTIRNGMKILN